MLSEGERWAFDEITRALAADPGIAAASRRSGKTAAARSARPRSRGVVAAWSRVVTRLERRFEARMRAMGRY